MDKRQIIDVKNRGKLVYFNIKKNSKMYLKKNELIKISGEIESCKNFDKIIDKVDCSDFFVHVNYLLYNQNNIKGYSMQFYKDVKNLKQLSKRSLALKKTDCPKIQKAFNFMTQNRLCYVDVYLKNFMITSSGELLITDLESLSNSKVDDLAYLNQRMASILSLSYLYNIEVNETLVLIKNRSIFLNNNNEMLLKYFSKLNKNSDIKELLKLISIDDIASNRKQLKRNSKILSKNEYFRKYYY